MTGLQLKRFSEENSAMVLDWRNADRIRENMIDDSHICEITHKEFLRSLSKQKSKAYFVVELNGLPVGAIYFTGIGGDTVTWGCYIGSERMIPGLFLALFYIAIKYAIGLHGANVLCSEVATHNLNPINLNRFLGVAEVARSTRMTTSGREVTLIEYRLASGEVCEVLCKAKKVMPSSIRKLCEQVKLET